MLNPKEYLESIFSNIDNGKKYKLGFYILGSAKNRNKYYFIDLLDEIEDIQPLIRITYDSKKKFIALISNSGNYSTHTTDLSYINSFKETIFLILYSIEDIMDMSLEELTDDIFSMDILFQD